jgi:hypothetical protein
MRNCLSSDVGARATFVKKATALDFPDADSGY